MNLSPVRKKRAVNYPTLAENKHLLHSFLSANIPLRWKNSRIASAIVSALLLLSKMRRSKGYAAEGDTTSQTVESEKKKDPLPQKHSIFSIKPAVSSIFEHGEGGESLAVSFLLHRYLSLKMKPGIL